MCVMPWPRPFNKSESASRWPPIKVRRWLWIIAAQYISFDRHATRPFPVMSYLISVNLAPHFWTFAIHNREC